MFLRIVRRIINKLGPRTLLYFCLQILGIGSVALGLADIVKGLQVDFVFRLVLLAVVFSWFLARTNINTWVGAFLIIIIGLVLLILTTGDLWGPVFLLFKEFFQYLWEFIHRKPDTYIDPVGFNLAYYEVSASIQNTIGAYRDWFLSIWEGIPIYDEIAISFVWGCVIWFVAGWAGWVLRRNKSPLLSFLPSGVILSVFSSYSWADLSSFPLLIFSTLLLLALENFDSSESRWISDKMDYPEDLRREFGLTATIMVSLIVLMASFLPNISFRSIVEYAQSLTAPHIEDAEPVIHSFGLNQNAHDQGGINKAMKGGYPRSHLLGSGPELEENVILTVQHAGGVEADRGIVTEFPFYWRALTYDDYYGLGWRSSDIVYRSYDAGEEILEILKENSQIIQLEFRIADDETQFIYSPGEILTVDNEFSVAYRPTIRFTEVFNAHGDFFGATIHKSRYIVHSVIPRISEEDLRKTKADYPVWIQERYLVLPETISARVVKLAEDLSKNTSNPYDKVKAIEKYLRMQL